MASVHSMSNTVTSSMLNCSGLFFNLFLHLCIYQSQRINMDAFLRVCVCVSNIKHESSGWCTCGFHIFSFFFFHSSSSGTVLSPLTCLLKGIRWWDFLRGRDERRMSRAPDNYCNHFVLGWYAVKSAERNYKRFRFNFAPLLSTAKNVVPTYVQNHFMSTSTSGSGSGS